MVRTESAPLAVPALSVCLLLSACGSGDLGAIAATGAPAARTEIGSMRVDAGPTRAADGRSAIDAGPVSTSSTEGVCGDGIAQAANGEQCDGNDLAGRTCENVGLGQGELICDPMTCRFLSAHCVLPPSTTLMPAPSQGADAGAGGRVVDAGSTPAVVQACPTGLV